MVGTPTPLYQYVVPYGRTNGIPITLNGNLLAPFPTLMREFSQNEDIVNSIQTSEKEGIWVIKDIVIATMSDKNWTREKRDELNFKPILIPILQEFFRLLMFDRDLSVYQTGETIFHYFYGETGLNGYEAQKFTQAVDAIQLKNFQFKMSKNCITYKK